MTERDFVAAQFDTDIRPDADIQNDPDAGSFHERPEPAKKARKKK